MKDLNEKTFDLLEETGLNWTVNKNQLVDREGRETQSFGMFRSNTGEWLGTVGERYTPLQNYELALILLQATEGLNLEVTRGGLLYKGQKVYMQAELPAEKIGNSNVKRWITCLNSHDGSTSIAFGSSNTTVVCQNTFFRAYGELQKFRHTETVKERIAIAQKDLRLTMNLDVELMTSFKRMADLPLKDEVVERVFKKLFEIAPETKASDISTRKTNQIKDFAGAVQTSINEQGSTVWALFNGVTRYTNHVSAPKEPEKKQDFLMANGGMHFSNVGYDEIMNWVNEKTPVLI